MSDRFGSDVVVESLQSLGIDYAAINPGASFRGMHASLVHLGAPELVLALNENVAVAIGHGYAKSSGKPMAVFLHNLVGLQSGSMGIFNAWADQVPMMLLGGAGPSDTSTRRPWIDWVHSTRMQSLVVRDYLKWDDQPTSVAALPDSVMRAHQIATTVPYGPTYIAVDAGLQEELVTAPAASTGSQFPPRDTPSITTTETALDEMADLLTRAERPVIVADYVGKSRRAYDALQALAEALACPVVDLMARQNFPTGHWADCTLDREGVLSDADVVLCLDLRDLAFGVGVIEHESHGYRPLVRSDARIISISTNRLMLKGFIDYSGPEGDAWQILADTAVCLPALANMVAERAGDRRSAREALTQFTSALQRRNATLPPSSSDGEIATSVLSSEVHRAASSGGAWEIANGHMRGQVRKHWRLDRFNAHLGQNVGAGLGYGIGVSIGAALAHRGDDTLIVNLQNDGDLMYAPGGLWTAARYGLPILTVMVNNRTYGQDRMHQSIVAKERGHPIENASVGIDIDNPEIDFAMIARAQGVEAWGPVTDQTALREVLTRAAAIVRDERRPVLVDAVVPR